MQFINVLIIHILIIHILDQYTVLFISRYLQLTIQFNSVDQNNGIYQDLLHFQPWNTSFHPLTSKTYFPMVKISKVLFSQCEKLHHVLLHAAFTTWKKLSKTMENVINRKFNVLKLSMDFISQVRQDVLIFSLGLCTQENIKNPVSHMK